MKYKRLLMTFLASLSSFSCVSSAKEKNKIVKKTNVAISENINKNKDTGIKKNTKVVSNETAAIVLSTFLATIAISSAVTWDITKNYYKDKKYEEIEHTVEKNMLREMAQEIIYKNWICSGKSNVSMSDYMDDNEEKILIKSIDNLVSLGLEIYNLIKPPAMYSTFWSAANNPVRGHKLNFWQHFFLEFINLVPDWYEIESSGKKEVSVHDFSVKLFIKDEVLCWEDLKVKQA